MTTPDPIQSIRDILNEGMWLDGQDRVDSVERALALLSTLPPTCAASGTERAGVDAQNWITLRNEGPTTLIVEVNGKTVIREFFASGECEVNHSFNLAYADIQSPQGDARVKAADDSQKAMHAICALDRKLTNLRKQCGHKGKCAVQEKHADIIEQARIATGGGQKGG